MLHQILIFKNNSGIVLFDKSLTQLCEDETQLGKEGIGMFFIGLKSLINEIITKKNTEIEEIVLKDYCLCFERLEQVECVLLLIADKNDSKKVRKIFPKIEDILRRNEKELIDWNGNMDKVRLFLEKPIQDLLIELRYVKEWIEFI